MFRRYAEDSNSFRVGRKTEATGFYPIQIGTRMYARAHAMLQNFDHSTTTSA